MRASAKCSSRVEAKLFEVTLQHCYFIITSIANYVSLGVFLCTEKILDGFE